MVTDNIQHFYCASVYPRTAQTYSYHGHRQLVPDRCAPVDPLTAQTFHIMATNKCAPVDPLTAQTYSYHGHRQLVSYKHAPVDPLTAQTFSPLCHVDKTLCTCTIQVCTYRSDSTLSFAPYYCALAQTFKPWPQTTSTTFTAHLSILRQHRHVHLYTRVTNNFQHPLIVLPLPSALEHSSLPPWPETTPAIFTIAFLQHVSLQQQPRLFMTSRITHNNQ